MKNSFETDQETIPMPAGGKIVLYHRPDHKNQKWQARIKIPAATGYVIRSTKKSDFYEARKFAEDLYDNLNVKVKSGGQLKSPTFKKVYEEWKESFRRKSKNVRQFDNYTGRIENYSLQYFSNTPIDTIKKKHLQDYEAWRVKNGIYKTPSANTLRYEAVAIKKVFDFAYDRDYITKPISIPKPSLETNVRPHFTRKEWNLLTRRMREYVKRGKGKGSRDRFLLQNYVLILCQTGIRCGELLKVSWSDVKRSITEAEEEGVIIIVDGKTGERDVVPSNPVFTRKYILRMLDLRKDELGKKPPPHEPIFCHKDGTRIGSFKSGFKRLLDETGLLKNEKGERRVLYSLRHTYAELRLAEGVDVYRLSQNMGTSPEMITKFYGSHSKNVRHYDELTKRKTQQQTLLIDDE
jgi:integrase